jgi:hypothetical protein
MKRLAGSIRRTFRWIFHPADIIRKYPAESPGQL